MKTDAPIPRFAHEDAARQRYILSVLALGSVVVLTFLDITILYESTIRGLRYGGISFLAFTAIVLFYILILLLVRRGVVTVPAHLFVGSYFLFGTYGAYQWGVSMPATLLIFALTIVMTGILLGSKKSFMMSGAIALVIIIVGYFESKAPTLPLWRHENVTTSDLYAYIFILCLMTTVSWLYSKEMKKSLDRARISEKALEEEKNSLEIRVEERSKEITKMQMDHMREVYRIAEFGRISSGLFHDLINPLTTLSLTVQELTKPTTNLDSSQKYIDNALRATKRMEDFMLSIIKHIKPDTQYTYCNISQELDAVCLLLQHKIKTSGVEIIRSDSKVSNIKTQPIFIQQILTNLISNAIDSYSDTESGSKTITISVKELDNDFTIEISDKGIGMSKETLSKIFTPFFTTKSDRGIGLGLATVHHIVTENLNGKIDIKSNLNEGTSFKITIPKNQCKVELIK